MTNTTQNKVHQSKTHKLNCLCGSIQLTATPTATHVSACHCSMCRHWGGPFMGVDCVDTVTFQNDSTLAVYASSEWAERGFCQQCGTHLFYRLKTPSMYHLPIGLFADLEGFEFTEEIFVDEQPALYAFANQTKRLTGEAAVAAFTATQ